MMSLKNLQRPSRLLSLLAVAATLVSCGSDDAIDPMASFTRQSLSWQTCDPTIVQTMEEKYQRLMTKLGDRVQCTSLRAPIDYANPGKGDIKVAMLRVRAEQPAAHNPSILFNPGGPGDDGLSLALLFGDSWTHATQEVTGPLYKQLSQRYDLIGFSPRGVGASTNLDCSSDLKLRYVADLLRDRSQTNIDNMLYNARLTADSCRNQPLMPYINSDATARDMDLMRQLLGDDKLNYIGGSYGTWLGNWYASLFPQRVGRMLLLGVTDFTKRLDNIYLPQEMAMQRVLDQVILPYAARHPEKFDPTRSAQDLRQGLNNLSPELRTATVRVLQVTGIQNSKKIDTSVLVLRAALRIADELKTNPQISEKDLIDDVTNFTYSSNEVLNTQAKENAQTLVKGYFFQFQSEPSDLANLKGSTATNIAVICNDSGVGFTPESWVRASNDSVARYPDFGGIMTDRNLCLYWNGPSVTRPPQSAAASAGGILLLQSEFDPWTPIEGALNSFAVLPNASLIEVSGEYNHSLLPPYGKECLDRPVAEYLLEGRQPARYSRCEGLPLSADASQ